MIQTAGLSDDASQILINNLNPQTQVGAQGVSIDDLAGDRVTLYLRLFDESGSMAINTMAVIQAANEQLAALAASGDGDSILMSTWTFNTASKVLYGYQALADVPQMDTNSYNPDGGTALFQAVLDGLTSLVSYAQSLLQTGVSVKIVVVIFSDGDDNANTARAQDVKKVVESLLQKELYTFAFVAFGINGIPVAQQIGVPNVMNVGATAHDIRLALGTVSKSVIRASQTVINANSAGGFFTP